MFSIKDIFDHRETLVSRDVMFFPSHFPFIDPSFTLDSDQPTTLPLRI